MKRLPGPQGTGEPVDPDLGTEFDPAPESGHAPEPGPESAPAPEPGPALIAAAAPEGRARGVRWRGQAPVIGAVAVGGAAGACARYGAALLWPTPDGGFPWTTLWVNVSGCAVIGVFLVLVTEAWTAHRLLRPFFGTGVLGGFTTFSTYAVDIQRLLDAGRIATGLAYLGLTLVAAVTAVWATAVLTRRAILRHRGGAESAGTKSAGHGGDAQEAGDAQGRGEEDSA